MGAGPQPTISLIADDPIGDRAEDRLERTAFAERAARVVKQVQAETSTAVMAMIGPWGSGKTSMLNLVAGVVAPDPEQRGVVRFNPWLVNDLESLVRSFFVAIEEQLPQGGHAREHLRRYAAALAPFSRVLAVIPGVGDVAADMTGELLGKAGAQPSLQTMHRKLNDALAELDRPLLIVVDDLDRLHPDELLLMFKLVRLAGRLPGLYYLLAFDERTLLGVLKTTEVARDSDERALAYLEKIVQVRLDLPPLGQRQAVALMDACWARVLTDAGMEAEPFLAEPRYRSMTDRWLDLGLDEPRKIKRLFAQADAVFPLLSGEVDATDFLAATYLRTYRPAHYRALRGAKAALARPGEAPDEGEAGGELGRALLALTELCPIEDASDLELSYTRRIRSADYFDRYFRLGIPADDIADARVAEALRATVGAGATAQSPAVAALLAAAHADPGRVLRKLQLASSGLESYAERANGFRVGALLYASLTAAWGWPANPVARWAGSLLRGTAIGDHLSRDDVEQMAGAGGAEYLALALTGVLPTDLPSDDAWSARRLLATWPGEAGEAILDAAWAVVDAAVDALASLQGAGEEQRAEIQRQYSRLRPLGPLARLERRDRVRPWLLERCTDGRLMPAALMAALYPGRHDAWRPERISLGELHRDWPLERVLPLAEIAKRPTHLGFRHGDERLTLLSFDNRMRAVDEFLPRREPDVSPRRAGG